MTEHTHNVQGEGHLRPRLSKITMVAMTFAILNTWICLAGSLSIVLPSGGSVAFLYGFIFCVLCNFALAASLGELAAIWPTAGGQYHFQWALTSEEWRKVMPVSLPNLPLPVPTDFVVYWSILSVFVASVVLLSTSDKTDPEFVFATFANETGWNDGIAWILGLLQSALSLIGYDAVLHMTEEMPTPSRDAPLAMVYAVGVGGTTGTIFILVMLFCLTDLSGIVATSTGMPIVELILQATGSRAGTTFLTLMLAICFIHGTNGSITSASRLLYAMARDKGTLYHEYFSHIHPRWEVPIRTIVLTWVFNAIFGLLYLGPTVAFNAFISSCTILLNMSYAIPVATLIIRGRDTLTRFQSADTPWRFGKVRGLIINYVAVLYVFITSIFFCFPPVLPVDASLMSTSPSSPLFSRSWADDGSDYVSAVIGIFAIFLTGYWVLYGRKTFQGPDLDVILGERPDIAEATDELAMEEKKVESPTE
ncbi:hypothetical protein BFJ72_g9547 [Fusarium proliferatum]|uniref:Choline transport protein n=1 Tax=Gibberella intermedia TaxID=948311 RepID=A0A420SXX7_GIBIN|nr:hypothetical protein BFJ72_g9547 [Fusarium proliferatum]